MAMQGVYQSRASAGLQALPQGYMEAATAPGRNLAAGISSFGESMGKAIEAYQKGKAQNEYLDKEFELLQEDLDEITGTSGADSGDVEGWGAAFGESYQEDLAKDIAKFSEMGLSQKKAKIADLKFDIDRFYKERDFSQKKSQADRQFNLQERQQDRLEEAAQTAADRAAADKEAYGLASGAIPIGESGYAPESPQGKAWTPKNRALQAAGSPEAAWRISQMKPAAPTMGQNVAAARQFFGKVDTYRGGVDPATGLPVDPQQLKTEALRLYGHSKEDVEGINEAWDEKFGAAEPKPGDVKNIKGVDWVWTSKGQLQRLGPQGGGAGDSYSKEFIEAAGDQIGRMHADNKTFTSFLEKYLPKNLWGEAYEKRTDFLGSQRTEKFPGMSANRMQQLKSFDQRIMAYESQLANASDAEAVRIRRDIAKYEKKSKEVIEAHMEDARKRDANLPPASDGLPNRTYLPGTDTMRRDK